MMRATGAGIVLWCVTVAAAVGVGWAAIELVGDDVGPGAASTAPTTPAVTTPTATPTPSVKPSPSASARPSPSATRSVAPTPRRTTSAPAVPTVRTWSGAAGSVRVSCSGGVIKLLGATPADGWRVERAESGSDVDVRFERDEAEVEVRARCSAGGPVFQVETDNESESESDD